jgi:hypothetical protein
VEGDIRVFDQSLLPMELVKDILFGLGTDRSGLPTSLIGDGKLRGVAAVFLEQHEESAAADLEDVQEIRQFDLLVVITLK